MHEFGETQKRNNVGPNIYKRCVTQIFGTWFWKRMCIEILGFGVFVFGIFAFFYVIHKVSDLEVAFSRTVENLGPQYCTRLFSRISSISMVLKKILKKNKSHCNSRGLLQKAQTKNGPFDWKNGISWSRNCFYCLKVSCPTLLTATQ